MLLGRQRRSNLGMCLDILLVIANGETKPARIMSKSNLAWRRFVKRMDYLLNLGLIKAERKDNCYRFFLTENGKNVVHQTKHLLFSITQITDPNNMTGSYSEEIKKLCIY